MEAPVADRPVATRGTLGPGASVNRLNDATAPQDVIVALGFTGYSAGAKSGLRFPEERLANALMDHPRVRRLLVCDPYRSYARKLGRTAIGRPDDPFPESATVAHHAPLRLLRHDPIGGPAVARVYSSYERGIRNAADRHGLIRPAVISANPLLAGFGDFSWAGPVTYYAWDDWTAARQLQRWWPTYEEAFRRLRAKHRRLVAVSAKIVDRIGPDGPTAIVANGIDPADWRELSPPPAWFEAMPRPRLLYVGTLESRIDIRQIEGLAAAFPEGSISLVGPLLDPSHLAPVRGLSNVHFGEMLPPNEIPALISAADVGLIPHVRSQLTEAMSPLKLYEYLAGGLPVAAVELPGNVGVSDRVLLVPPGTEMTDAVRRALALGPQRQTDRLAFLAENSWEHRFNELLDVAFANG
jgi:teichuronic acid biosynthesis glycosyltransferase TuaH